MKIRGRTFSGTSGVWFRRKKRTPPLPAALLSATSSAPWSLSSLSTNNNNNNGHPVSSQTPIKKGETQSVSTCSQKFSVDWDDVRCRPIYEGRSSQNEDTENMDSLESELDELYQKDNSSMVSSSSSTSQENCGKQNMLVNTRVSWLPHKRKRKDNVSRRGKRKFGSTHTAAALVDITPPLTKRLVARHQETAEDHVHSSSTYAVPTSLLRRPRKGTTATCTPAVEFPETNLDFDENECKAIIDTNFSTSTGPAPKTPHQPTSKTSLSMARRFFEQLDSNHPLQMDHSDTAVKALISTSLSTSPARETGRTRRSPRVSREQVCRKEYRHYCEACLVADVKPLTLRIFLSERSTFFDRSRHAYTGDDQNDEHGLPGERLLYDGLFDD